MIEADTRISQTHSLRERSARAATLHVICHINGVQLIGQEPVSQVHALLLPTAIDRHHARIYDDNHAHYQLVALQDLKGQNQL